MNILRIVRLKSDIVTGIVIKIFLETEEEELEHSIHILLGGSVKRHCHDNDAEGYREWNISNSTVSDWQYVGVGATTKSHEIPYKRGLRIVEGRKIRKFIG